MEVAQVGLDLLRAPSQLGLPARHLGERGEPRGERGIEEPSQLVLDRRVELAAHGPHRVDKCETGPLEPVGAEVEHVGEAIGPLVPHPHRLIADHEETVRLRRLEPAHVANAVEPAVHVEQEPQEPHRGRCLGRDRDEPAPERARRTSREERHRLDRAARRHAERPDQLEAIAEPQVVGGGHEAQVDGSRLGLAPELAGHQVPHRERRVVPQRVEGRRVGVGDASGDRGRGRAGERVHRPGESTLPGQAPSSAPRLVRLAGRGTVPGRRCAEENGGPPPRRATPRAARRGTPRRSVRA